MFFHNLYVLISFILFLLSMSMMMLGSMFLFLSMEYYMEWNLMLMNSMKISFSLMMDYYSLYFSSIVMLISSAVFLFSKSYMSSEIFIRRFVLLLILFIMSMIMLVFSGNLVTVLLGWDGLGLVSFLLVIYYQNKSSLSGGLLTLLTNRIGDIALIMSLSLMMFWGYYSLSFISLGNVDYKIIILVFLSAMTKSAQMPFSAWLPAAMAAPTPVSSLVHSSTLVTAGVYLLIRFDSIPYMNNMNILLYLALMTMVMSGISANMEYDMKKIIALSTLSQLSVMFLAIAINMKFLAYFHMMTHALFKALMFLSAGSIMHGFFGNQDMRYKGSMQFSPFICLSMNLSMLSLMGMPFLAGFYSKDLILENFFMNDINLLMMIILVISTGLTVMYSMRMSYYVFFNNMNFNSSFSMFNNYYIFMSLGMLMTTCLFSGTLFSWMVFPIPVLIYLNFKFKLLIFLIFIFGIILGLMMSNMLMVLQLMKVNNNMMTYYLSQMWFISACSTQLTMMYPLFWSKNLMKMFDMGWGEYYGGQGLFKTLNLSSNLNNFKLYNMSFYYLSFMLWLIMAIMFMN
uniref:NADH-ubiquinone oxidoreductase chain 5 n=1 Tax=Achelia bituberculata TaxID=262805 RepID=A7E1Q1_ACHBT|nr:NADH dehydrogenase subunit 5 [Achelia bituberculata]